MPDLLLELFSEEIPARMQRKAAGDLRRLVTDALVNAGLTYEGAKEYWTPRRLVLDVRGVIARSAGVTEEKKGPRTDAPAPAIQGFLRGAGLGSIDQAQIRSDPKKGDFYVAVISRPGRDAKDIIAQALPPIIREFPWPKSMRWGEASRQPGSLRWVRPLQSILCTFGPETEEPEVIPFEIDGLVAGNLTRGHRFLAPGAFAVKRFDDYAAKLEAAKVILDPERRKQMILADAGNLAFAQGYELVADEGLAEETANLTEWPVVLMGEFDEAFLDIPAEVVRLTIRVNQKCFVMRKRGSEALANRFLLVSNIAASDGGREIARGNGKVVRARLSDAKFFWDSDLQIARSKDGFARWIANLDGVTFHAKLGSQGERVKRIMALAGELAPIVGADPAMAERAAYLAKADLQSAMVFEFPEVQGKMGRRYYEAYAGILPSPLRGGSGSEAGRGGGRDNSNSPPPLSPPLKGEGDSGWTPDDHAAVARAIEEHYKPLGPADDVPSDPVSIAVALADKLDTLVGFWAIDEKPTGSKDPFALRRAALGVIRLVVENGVRLTWRVDKQTERSLLSVFAHSMPRHFVGLQSRGLKPIVAQIGSLEARGALPAGYRETFVESVTNLKAAQEFAERTSDDAWKIASDLLSFFHERLKVFLRDEGVRHDVIDAVITVESDDLLLIVLKARALQKLIDADDGKNLLAGYRRAANILAAEEKKGAAVPAEVQPGLLKLESELQLAQSLNQASNAASQAIEKEDFSSAMQALAKLRAPIDSFFEKVLVNDPDNSVRLNRLALLARIRAATATVADFSKIAG